MHVTALALEPNTTMVFARESTEQGWQLCKHRWAIDILQSRKTFESEPVQSEAPTWEGKTPMWEIKSDRNDSVVVLLDTKAQFDHQQLAFNLFLLASIHFKLIGISSGDQAVSRLTVTPLLI